VALPRDLVRLVLLLVAELAVDGAERGEVAAERARQQALLEAPHRRRSNQLVERLPLLRQVHLALGLERRGARAPVPEPRRLAGALDLVRRPQDRLVHRGRDQLLRFERPVVRRQLGELERPQQHAEPLAGPDVLGEVSVVAVPGELGERLAQLLGQRDRALDDFLPAAELHARHRR
jgi:hypothetical protein